MNRFFEENREQIFELGDNLFTHPQLGYKETENKEYLRLFLEKYGLQIENECFETAFTVSIGEGFPHIGLIAELDALPTLGHKYSNPQDNNAAHSCGHSTQCAIMAAVMAALKTNEISKGKVTLFFTPAEEYTDIEYRKQLISENKIKYIGGKQNMIEAGMFDNCDYLIHLHTSTDKNHHFSVNTRQGGFVYKKITFLGKAAHAAVNPWNGVNALNAYSLFNNAINMLRERFREEDSVRIHGIINEGGQTVNSIPERVVYECYVRSFNIDTIREISAMVDNAAECCSRAIGADCQIETENGYVPLVQSEKLNEIVYEHMKNYCDAEQIKCNSSSMAASDLGDLSLFKPVIQLGYGGFCGVAHSKDLDIVDEERVYIETAELIEETVRDLLDDDEKSYSIINSFNQRMNKEDYYKYLNNQ